MMVEIEPTFLFPKLMLLYIQGKKSKDNTSFSKITLNSSLKHPIQNCYFMVCNSILRQKTPVGIDPVSFSANCFLYTYENEYMSRLISNDKVKGHHFYVTKRFSLSTLNDGVELNDICKNIYLSELKLKIEHFGIQATFLNLDIAVKNGVFVYKLFC